MVYRTELGVKFGLYIYTYASLPPRAAIGAIPAGFVYKRAGWTMILLANKGISRIFMRVRVCAVINITENNVIYTA